VEAKRLLGITALNRDGESIRLEPIFAFEYLVRHGRRRKHGCSEEICLAI